MICWCRGSYRGCEGENCGCPHHKYDPAHPGYSKPISWFDGYAKRVERQEKIKKAMNEPQPV